MSREEFLRRLEEALAGEVPVSVIRENVSYYNGYISQEMAKGRTMEQIIEEIGDPRIVARTIIDSCEAAGETIGEDGYGKYSEPEYENRSDGSGMYGSGNDWDSAPKIHYFDLNKWYWKLLLAAIFFLVMMVVFSIVGGIFALLVRFSGPILLILLLYWFIKNLRR